MNKLLLLSFLFLTACASSGSYRQESWAKTNYAEAHNDCKVKAAVAVGQTQQCQAMAQWGCNLQYKRAWADFMHECMEGQGYTWVKN
jgi:hypothetical protein